MAAAKRIEYPFVIDALAEIDTQIRSFFGCTAIYRDEKILLVLRESDAHVEDNGVWVATEREHHASLRNDFPSLRSIGLFGTRELWDLPLLRRLPWMRTRAAAAPAGAPPTEVRGETQSGGET